MGNKNTYKIKNCCTRKRKRKVKRHAGMFGYQNKQSDNNIPTKLTELVPVQPIHEQNEFSSLETESFEEMQHDNIIDDEFENKMTCALDTTKSDDEDLIIEAEKENEDYLPVNGRRIVDVIYFICQFQEKARHNGLFDCKAGDFKLIGEKREGLISKFKFECNLCKEVVTISSENTADKDNVDVNIAATTGIVAAGIGHAQFQEICSSMNVPIFSSQFYSKLQDQVYEKWEEVAVESMEAAAQREKEAAIAEGKLDKDGNALIDVNVDGCWCARSYGNNFKASSGAAAIIGKRFGEVLYVGIKNKYCLACARAEKKNAVPKEHKCFKNYSGSATGMESQIIVEGFKSSVEMYGIVYERVVGDGDASTYYQILKADPYSEQNITVVKIECRNHILRNFCKKLRTLTTETKYTLAHRKTLTNTRIMSMRKAIVKSIEHHNSNTERPKTVSISLLYNDINNVVAHAYGDHKLCSDYNCTRNKDEKNDMPLIQNSTFLFRINSIVASPAAKSSSLIENVDTNTVERFNSVIAKFVGGKRVNFSLKRGYQARCSAAVVSFNSESSISSVQKAFLGKSPKGQIKELERRRSLKRKINKEHPIKKLRKICQNKTKPQHDYGIASTAPDLPPDEMEKTKLQFLSNLEIFAADRVNIERSTVLQRDSSEWLDIRKKIITASNFGLICKRQEGRDTSCLVKSILYQKNLSRVTSIAHGIENEKRALQQLEKQESIIIEPCGIFIDKNYPFLGASPDGFVGQDMIIEIKCPITAFKKGLNEAIKSNKIQILRNNKKTNTISINTQCNWYYQIQGQLHITGRQMCMMGIWAGENEPVHVLTIEKDDKFWETKMFPKLKNFYINCMLPEIIDPRYKRGMELRKINLMGSKLSPVIPTDSDPNPTRQSVNSNKENVISPALLTPTLQSDIQNVILPVLSIQSDPNPTLQSKNSNKENVILPALLTQSDSNPTLQRENNNKSPKSTLFSSDPYPMAENDINNRELAYKDRVFSFDEY